MVCCGAAAAPVRMLNWQRARLLLWLAVHQTALQAQKQAPLNRHMHTGSSTAWCAPLLPAALRPPPSTPSRRMCCAVCVSPPNLPPNPTGRLYDGEALMGLAFRGIGAMPGAQIESLRASAAAAVDAQLAEQSARLETILLCRTH